jgi:hypothetical protein
MMLEYLFALFKFSHNTVVILLSDTLGITNGIFNKGFETVLHQLIDLVVIVIVMLNTVKTLDIIPNGDPEARRVDFTVVTHRFIGEVVSSFEFIVQQIANVVVEASDEGIAVISPRIVLDAKREGFAQLATLKMI